LICNKADGNAPYGKSATQTNPSFEFQDAEGTALQAKDSVRKIKLQAAPVQPRKDHSRANEAGGAAEMIFARAEFLLDAANAAPSTPGQNKTGVGRPTHAGIHNYAKCKQADITAVRAPVQHEAGR
jgi:hypothetical protein